MWGCDLLHAAAISLKLVEKKKSASIWTMRLWLRIKIHAYALLKWRFLSRWLWKHDVFSSPEELSISISVSNCQVQENVVSGPSYFSDVVAQFPRKACTCTHSCAIKVSVGVKSEIVSDCVFIKTSGGSFHAAQMGKLLTHISGQGSFVSVPLLHWVKVKYLAIRENILEEQLFFRAFNDVIFSDCQCQHGKFRKKNTAVTMQMICL